MYQWPISMYPLFLTVCCDQQSISTLTLTCMLTVSDLVTPFLLKASPFVVSALQEHEVSNVHTWKGSATMVIASFLRSCCFASQRLQLRAFAYARFSPASPTTCKCASNLPTLTPYVTTPFGRDTELPRGAVLRHCWVKDGICAEVDEAISCAKRVHAI